MSWRTRNEVGKRKPLHEEEEEEPQSKLCEAKGLFRAIVEDFMAYDNSLGEVWATLLLCRGRA